MPVKLSISTTRESIIHTPLPDHGGAYTVIPHEFVINTSKTELANTGFSIKHELYKSTLNGEIAQGMYHIDHQQDPDIGMMFAWSNSYNKQMRFKCAIGAHVFVCMNGVVSGSLDNFSRKHIGDAKEEAEVMIKYQISKAYEHFNQLIQDKNILTEEIISKKTQAELIGRLFLEEKVLTLTQLGIVKREIENPSFLYNADPDSAWVLYNHITHALKESHPVNYLNNHQKVHELFINQFSTPVINMSEPELDFSPTVKRVGNVIFA